MKEGSIILLDINDNAIGHPVYDRWNKLPWYKRLFGFFFYNYKRKFIDLVGFDVKMTDGVIDGLTKEDFKLTISGEEKDIPDFKDLGDGNYFIDLNKATSNETRRN